MELGIDTKKGKITLDGKDLNTVTDISFKWSVGKLPEITITCDMQLLFGGELSTKGVAEVKCPYCGAFIGKIGGHFHSVKCPKCCEIINSSMVEFLNFDFDNLA